MRGASVSRAQRATEALFLLFAEVLLQFPRGCGSAELKAKEQVGECSCALLGPRIKERCKKEKKCYSPPPGFAAIAIVG